MTIKLKDRIDSYQSNSSHRLLDRVPLVLIINGKSFSKVTSLLEKPYCSAFAESLYATAFRLSSEIDGCVFTYSFNDEIVCICKNDQTVDTMPWFNNDLQKICSVVSSLATLHFNNSILANDINLFGDAIFSVKAFNVPNITEVVNTLIFKQQQNFYVSVHNACIYEMLHKGYNTVQVKEMLNGLSIDDKISLLKETCDIEFNSYPSPFKRGVAFYKTPHLINESIKYKWKINIELPIFTNEQVFLTNIIKNGTDIVRDLKSNK